MFVFFSYGFAGDQSVDRYNPLNRYSKHKVFYIIYDGNSHKYDEFTGFRDKVNELQKKKMSSVFEIQNCPDCKNTKNCVCVEVDNI
jgi:hypothetical protein